MLWEEALRETMKGTTAKDKRSWRLVIRSERKQKNNTMPCSVLVCLADTQQTVTLMRKMWMQRRAER